MFLFIGLDFSLYIEILFKRGIAKTICAFSSTSTSRGTYFLKDKSDILSQLAVKLKSKLLLLFSAVTDL